MMVIDDNPLAKVTLTEIINEYNYSNPTGYFNISLPHIDMRTNMYQTMSYQYFKRMTYQNEMQAKNAYKEAEEEKLRESQASISMQEDI